MPGILRFPPLGEALPANGCLPLASSKRRTIVFKEFKEFAMRGSVLDLAVGVIIGAAFGKIVSSLVDDILMPPLGQLLHDVNFSDLFINLSGTHFDTLKAAKDAGKATLNYEQFHQYHHQFPHRSIFHFCGGARRESLDAQSSRASHHEGLPAMRHGDTCGRKEVRALRQRGLAQTPR